MPRQFMKNTSTLLLCEYPGYCDIAPHIFYLPTSHSHIALCQIHAHKRGYFNNPYMKSDTKEAKEYAQNNNMCEDIHMWESDQVKNVCIAHGRPNQCSSNRYIVFYMPESKTYVSLCPNHAGIRGYLETPRALSFDKGLRQYISYLQYFAAKKKFVQKYNPNLTCILNSDACKKDEVAEYCFSDGGHVYICTAHLKDSNALMSKQYYDEVYEKYTL